MPNQHSHRKMAFGSLVLAKNMVSAIWYWALACDVLEERAGGKMQIGGVGRALFGSRRLDSYLEKPRSVVGDWLLAAVHAKRSTI